jgi:hypothetical protein
MTDSKRRSVRFALWTALVVILLIDIRIVRTDYRVLVPADGAWKMEYVQFTFVDGIALFILVAIHMAIIYGLMKTRNPS